MHSAMHAENSAEKFGGKAADYMEIHAFLDSSKSQIGDARHRTLTHTSWFIREILPRIFGHVIINSDQKKVPVVEIAELHVLEDFGMLFIPTAQDFLGEMELTDWMDNARGKATPPSRKKIKDTTIRPSSIPENTPRPSSFRPQRGCRGGAGVMD